MKIVTISEAKSKLSSLIDSVEHGEQVLIMRGSHPAVTLTPVSEEDLSFSPEFSLKTLHSFESEIAAERKAGKLVPLGKNSEEAANALRKLK
jgi:prevent-host-death family protein